MEFSGFRPFQAVREAKQFSGFSQKVEVEARNMDEARRAAVAGADVVMLDNFTPNVCP